jgi:hypothetical protein
MAKERSQVILRRLSPTLVALLLAALLVFGIVAISGHGDPLYLARLGSFYSQDNPTGKQGYDGQFVYFIARDLNPQSVAAYLDVPAYRYQRILLPLLARILALGNLAVIPWTLIVIGLASYAFLVWILERILAGWQIPRRYAYLVGLWAGFLLALIVDLPEPLAYVLVAGGILALQRDKPFLGWILLGLSLFAKEVTVLFLAAVFLDYLLQRRWRFALGFLVVAGLPFAVFQLWLWTVFGQPGIGSGGAMATPFELIPFMGLLRIGFYSPLYLLAMLVVFGPTVVWPSIWGIWQAVKSWLSGERNMVVLALLINALAILIMPFSTFRETGGVLRYACGLALALVLFAARYRQIKVLNYCAFWIVLNLFIFK